MKKYIIALIGLTATLTAFGQSTNLTPNMLTVFTNLSPAVQASTLTCLLDYNKAVRRSPEFAGVVTNISITLDTNGVPVSTNSVVTTNRFAMTLTEWLHAALANEKVSRVVQQRNDALKAEIYFRVGQTVVDGWGN